MMEQIITDETGENLRCDLVVYGPTAVTVVEFKSGTPEILPDPAHIRQVEKYIDLLSQAQPLPVKGILALLLTRKKLWSFNYVRLFQNLFPGIRILSPLWRSSCWASKIQAHSGCVSTFPAGQISAKKKSWR